MLTDVVIVSRGRQDFLDVVLSCLLSQSSPVRVHLAHHEDFTPTYLHQQMRELYRQHVTELNEETFPLDWSLARIRATLIDRVQGEWVLMLDNDTWFPHDTLAWLHWGTMQWWCDTRTIALGFPHVDVLNERDYPDYNPSRVYRSLREFVAEHGINGCCFNRFRQAEFLPHMHTHALWNVRNLRESGVLDFWREYPVGVRQYDYQGSKLAVERGYNTVLLPGRVFWHLWTIKSDKGYFDVKGSF